MFWFNLCVRVDAWICLCLFVVIVDCCQLWLEDVLPVLIPSPIALVQCGGYSLLSSGVCETCSLAGTAALHQCICCTSVSVAEKRAANPWPVGSCAWLEMRCICAHFLWHVCSLLVGLTACCVSTICASPSWALVSNNGRQTATVDILQWYKLTRFTNYFDPKGNVSRFQYITQTVFYHFSPFVFNSCVILLGLGEAQRELFILSCMQSWDKSNSVLGEDFLRGCLRVRMLHLLRRWWKWGWFQW